MEFRAWGSGVRVAVSGKDFLASSPRSLAHLAIGTMLVTGILIRWPFRNHLFLLNPIGPEPLPYEALAKQPSPCKPPQTSENKQDLERRPNNPGSPKSLKH